MAPRAAVSYRWQGPAMLRATTSPGPADLPSTLNLDDAAATRGWLRRTWQQPAFRDALRAATPVLSAAVEAVVTGARPSPARSGEPRCPRSPTCCGGRTAPPRTACSPAPPPWPSARPMPSGARSTGCWCAPTPNGSPTSSCASSPTRSCCGGCRSWPTTPLAGAVTASSPWDRRPTPTPGSGPDRDLRAPRPPGGRRGRGRAQPIVYERPAPAPAHALPAGRRRQIDRLLRDLIGQQILLTSLWAPMTTLDALGHLCAELERLSADSIPDLHDLVTALYEIRDEITARQPWRRRARPPVRRCAPCPRRLRPPWSSTPASTATCGYPPRSWTRCRPPSPRCTAPPRSPTATSTGATTTAASAPGTASAPTCPSWSWSPTAGSGSRPGTSARNAVGRRSCSPTGTRPCSRCCNRC